MLALVPDVVTLEAEEGAEPVDKIKAIVPLDKRRRAEVANGTEGSHGGANLGEPKRRVLRQ